MKKVLTTLSAFVAFAGMAMTANAAVSVTLVSPPEGDVSNPGHFPTIQFQTDAIEQVNEVTMSLEGGESVSCPFGFNDGTWKLEVNCSKVTKSGKWTLTIPAGALDQEGEANEQLTYSWNYTNPTEGEAPAEFALSAYVPNVVGESTVKVNPGESFENATGFPNINIVMPEYGYTINNTELQLTSDKGYDKNISVNSMFYNMNAVTEVLVMSGDEEIKESATYTLHIPAGFATSGTESSAAADLSWTYTYKGGSTGPVDPSDIVVKSFTVGGVDILKTPELAALHAGDEIIANINPIPDAMMLTVEFRDNTNDEVIRSFEIYDNPYNEDVKANPAEGYYRTAAGGAALNKFYTGTEYSVVLNAYSTTNIGNPANLTWGPVTLNFTGTTEPYKFSPVTVESVSPEDGFQVVDPSQPIVITYSAPVTLDRVEASSGGQGAVIVDMLPYATPNADNTVWTIKPGKSFWETSDSDWMFMFYAKDENGLVVKGNQGTDEGSYYQVGYGCYLAWPTVEISPASGMVEELYSFTIADTSGIGLSYNATPYVVNEAGETVATVDMDSQIQYDAQGRDIMTVEGEVKAVKAVFHLNVPITEPGKYTFVSPQSAYAIGTEFSGKSNRYFETEYTVVKMPKVNVDVELVNFASVSFEVLQGKDAVVSLAPAADWKVASLTLNGEDVTSDVTDNTYKISAIEKDAKLVATYEYAHDVEIVQSTGIVNVEGRDITVANDADRIAISGLVKGDTIKVYSVNGMVLANLEAEQEVVKITCPTGQVYVVVVNNKAIKIQH